MIIVVIFIAIVFTLILGVFVYGADLIDTTFNSIDFSLGDINFSDSYDDTLGQGINAFLNSADNWGIGLLLGMVVLMVLCAWVFRTDQTLWMIGDFGILVVSVMLTVILQQAYDSTIRSSSALFDIFSNTMIMSSTFVLNLHIIVPIIWGFIVVISYGLLKKKSKFEEVAGVGF